MNRLTKHLVVISFDGLATLDFERLKSLPGFNGYMQQASFCEKVYSIYPTLTYPAHTSIITGRYPKSHGVIDNTFLQPGRESPDWYWHRRHVRGGTLYDEAKKAGMKTAALLWPVTARARIDFNMPEIFANRPWQNQIMVSLANGSPFFQFKMNQLFGHLRHGKNQPDLDHFTHQSLLYTLKHYKPELVLVHYTDLDTMRHHHGFDSEQAQEALGRHARRLSEIIQTLKDADIYEESTVVVLGDHSSLDAHTIVNLNVLFREKGWISVDSKTQRFSYEVICKNCDGSAYIYMKNERDERIKEEIRELLQGFNNRYHCIEEIYTGAEAGELGADQNCAFMLEACRGYYFLDSMEGDVIKPINPAEAGVVPHVTLNTHGYSPNKEDYTTVFMAAGKGIRSGVQVERMDLVDEGPTLARLLGLELKEADGKVVE